MATIDNLSLSITAQATDATKKIDALSNALKGLKGSTNLSSAVNNLTKLKEALSALNRIKVNNEKLKSVASGIRSINNAISGISTASINRLERATTALEKLGYIKRVSKSVSKAFQESTPPKLKESDTEQKKSISEEAEGAKKVKEQTKEASESAAHFKKRVDSIAQALRQIASAPLKAIGKAFTSIGNTIKRLVSPITSLLRSLGRIALYRLLRSVIKEITVGIKEGVQNLAKFSKAMNELDTHQANKVMSLYASNFLYLKNTIATAVIPTLKALEPIISSVINKVIDFTNVLAQLFSALTGSKTYTKAKYYYLDYAESLDKASGSAGKLNKQLAQFDELNNLTTSKGSGSDNELDYTEMFTDPVPIADWIQKLKDEISKGNWEAIGQAIADKIKNGLGKINWEEQFEKSFNKGKDFALFLNGLIDPEAFKEVGKTISGAIMTGVNFALGFADKFEFDELGESIGEGINGFFENFDGIKASEAISKIAHGLNTALNRAVETIKWGEVFKDLFQFFSHLVIDNIDLIVKYLVIANAIGFVVNFTSTLLAEIGKQLAAKIAAKVGIELTGMTITSVGSMFGVQLAQGVATSIAAKTGSKITAEMATQTVSAELGTVNVGVGAGTKVLGASTVGGYIAAAIVAAVVGYFTGRWIENKLSDLYGTDTWAFEEHGGLSGNAPNPYGKPNVYTSGQQKKAAEERHKNDNIVSSQQRAGIIENFQNNNKDVIITDTLFGGNVPKVARQNTPRSISQQIYDTKAAEAFKKLNNSTQQSAKNASSASTAFTNMGKQISSSSSSAYGEMSRNASTAYNKVSSASATSASSANKNISSVKTTGDKTFNYGVWNNYGKNITDTVGKGISAVENEWNSLVKSIGAGLNINVKTTTTGGGATATSQTIYIPTTYVPSAENGELKQKTWHNLPTKPSYLPTSSYASWLEEWKRNHPENYYAQGGFPTEGSMFVAGEAGAELVGNFNGRTGVANTDQITEAMYTATYDAMSTALAENPSRFIIEGDADGMFRIMQQKANNFFTRTGRPAF